METWYYEVASIEGDYANLKRTDISSEDMKLVARALLPPEIVEGSRLKYEMMQYEMAQGGEPVRFAHIKMGRWKTAAIGLH